MATTIQISDDLQKELVKRKMYEKETYEEVIRDLIEDAQEISAQAKRELAQARAEIRAGKSHDLAKVKKELGL